MIPLSKPYHFKEELQFMTEVLETGELSGNGKFTERCHIFFKKRFDINKCLLTTSCTTALEMAALLLDLKNGDEVIVPAYSYVSTANAFALRGASLIYVDSQKESPNMNLDLLPDLINDNTKAIVVMHYGSIAVDMDKIMKLANKHNLIVIEDAAHCVDSFYKKRALGSIGHIGVLSFHSTKNITCGHGGLLMINDRKFQERAEILWQKGTDKSKFDAGLIKKYQWQDLGSSFFPPEIIAAQLFGQLHHIKSVTEIRKNHWEYYNRHLQNYFEVPTVQGFANHNGHIFYIKAKSSIHRKNLQQSLKFNDIISSSHYLSLSEAPYNERSNTLLEAKNWEDCLLRLPMYHKLTIEQQHKIITLLIKCC